MTFTLAFCLEVAFGGRGEESDLLQRKIWSGRPPYDQSGAFTGRRLRDATRDALSH
jgi:hypothetical protein